MNCPRCRTTLEAREVEGRISVQTCPGCTGTLVVLNQLVPLLEAMAAPLSHVVDLHEPIDPVADLPGDVPCPKCRKPMTSFGYLGTNLVTPSRCTDDLLIWADAGELGVMSMLYLRTNKRLMERQGFHNQIREGMARSTHLALKGRAAAERIARGMLAGGSYRNRAALWDLLD